MGTFGLWFGSGAAAVRRRCAGNRRPPESTASQAAPVSQLLMRLRELESARVSDGADAGLHRDGGTGSDGTVHQRMLELTAIIRASRTATDPDVRALTARAGTELRHALRSLCDRALSAVPGLPAPGFPAPALPVPGMSAPGLPVAGVPAAGEPGPLDAAVQLLAAAMPLAVRVTVDAPSLGPAAAATAYAVICEALANVVGHAHARRAAVTVRRHGPTVQIAVADDGDGGAQPVIGGGIVMLAARAAVLGGMLHVDSPPGSGTHLTVELPHDA